MADKKNVWLKQKDIDETIKRLRLEYVKDTDDAEVTDSKAIMHACNYFLNHKK